ncbi:arsenate reductase family protein [Litchfieldia salsa]|uniref:Arsenate reductase n=1 Tax=Litchfieldia salsa TaxID=930152 RepID=A0A1H0WPE3_9BACI|nr:arsenate reductase family protein [Litchfieldia salsa]SDP92590.1 arsenate reductase [Litchfieldia salsa]
MTLTFYWYPKCSTCRNAKKLLEEHNISFEEVHIVENNPTREVLTDLYQKSGLELKKFFNTSGQKYRELGLKDKMKTSTDEELLDLLATDGMLVKRPLLTNGEKVTVGFNEKMYKDNWLS